MEEAQMTEPNFRLKFDEKVSCAEWSPYEWSQNLICIALKTKIIVATVKFQEDEDIIEDMDYTPLKTFDNQVRIHTIAWSPETSLSVVPKIVSFCVADAEYKIRMYHSDLDEQNVYQVLDGHSDYVNALSYDPEGELLASVSDDHTCKLWSIQEEQVGCALTFRLTSAGMSVRWHAEETSKLMVGEKNGIIRMYNVRSQQAIMSVDAGQLPVLSADWSPNPLKVASCAAGDLFVWDLSRPSRPIETRTLFTELAYIMKFAPSNENLIAGVGRPDNMVKVVNLKTKPVILCSKVLVYGGLSWHQRLEIFCAGSDRSLLFWKVNNQ